MRERVLRYFEIFNEATFLAINYVLLSLECTNDPNPLLTNNAGWLLIAIIGFNLMVNNLNVVFEMLSNFYLKCQKCRRERL